MVLLIVLGLGTYYGVRPIFNIKLLGRKSCMGFEKSESGGACMLRPICVQNN